MNSSGHESSTTDNETTPLRIYPSPGGPRTRFADVRDGSVNLINTIIGGGMLALPFAFKSSGILLGSLFLVAFWLLSTVSARLVIRCSEPPIEGGTSYSALARAAFGKWGPLLIEVTTIVFVFGATVGYLVIVGDVMTPYINKLFDCDRRLVILFFGGLVCFPLSCLRQLTSLKFTSFIGLFFIIYLVGCIMVSCAVKLANGDIDLSQVVLVKVGADFLSVLPIIAFAFTFHTNVLLVWREMGEFPDASANIRTSIDLSTSVCFAVYLICACFGYISFQNCTSDNILTHYEGSDWYFDIGKIGYGLIIMFSYPLLAYPLRCSVDSILGQYVWPMTEHDPVSTRRLFLTSLGIFVASYLFAILPIGIGLIFAITGATAGNLIVFGLPCFFYIVLETRYPLLSREKLPSVLLLILSFALTVTGLFSAVAFQVLGGLDQGLQNASNQTCGLNVTTMR